MNSRRKLVLTLLSAALLLAIAGLHGSGYGYVSRTLRDSELPTFLKQVLPPLYLYPSVLLAILAIVVLLSLRAVAGRAFVLRVVAAIVGANAVLGFVLGGAVPGGVLLLVAAFLWMIPRLEGGETSLRPEFSRDPPE